MTEHTVKSYEQELEALSAGIAQMGGLAEAQVAASLDAIIKRDVELAERTIHEDDRIDRLEIEIEAMAVALRQPMASDLRETISGIKISSDLERIGDLAKNSAKRARATQRDMPEPWQLIHGLSRMGRLSLAQLKDVLDAYTDRDAEKALAVWNRDEEIDEMYNSIFRELLTYMMEDPRTIGVATHLMFVTKNLERIGDHATNIAETVIYLVTGEAPTDERPKSDTTSGVKLPLGASAE